MKRMTESLKLSGNYAVYSESTYRRGKKKWSPPHHVLDKMLQMMQSNDTETMNLDKDFEEMANKAKQTWWKWIDQKQHGSGQKKRNTIRNQSCSALKPANGTHYELCGRMALP